MKKHSFYTLGEQNGKVIAVLVDGFYDEGTKLHYYKNGILWYSVCPLTGTSLASGKTRKECVTKTIEALPAYETVKHRLIFNSRVEQYNEAVKIALATR